MRRWMFAGLAGILFPFTRSCLRLRGLGNTRQVLSVLFKNRREPDGENEIQARVAESSRIVRRVGDRLFPKAKCLPRSLVLWTILGMQGIATELQLGARQRDGKFQAHAWLERDGKAINEFSDVAERYARFEKV